MIVATKIYSSKYYGVEATPVNPKYSGIDEKMQLGYKYSDEGDKSEAAKTWMELWDDILTAMKIEKVGSMSEFDTIFNGNESVMNWVNDYDYLLTNLTNKWKSKNNDFYRFCNIKISFNEQLLTCMNESEKLHIENANRIIAETYFEKGKWKKAKRYSGNF